LFFTFSFLLFFTLTAGKEKHSENLKASAEQTYRERSNTTDLCELWSSDTRRASNDIKIREKGKRRIMLT